MVRITFVAVCLLMGAQAHTQPLPSPQFNSPAIADSSSRAATTGWVRSQGFATTTGDLSQATVQIGGSTVARTLAARAAATFNVLDYGAKADGNTDLAIALNTIASQLAPNSANVITIPAGNYVLKSPVVFSGVAPVFEGQGFTAGPAPASGTMITITATGFVPFTFSGTNARGAVIRNLAVREIQPATGPGWQPGPYDYVFKVLNALGEVTFDNVYFAGVTRGIYADNSGRLNLRDVTGQFYTAGVEIDDCYDIPRIQHLHAWTYQSADPSVVSWQEANEDTVILRRVDGIFIDNLFTLGARSAIHFTTGVNGVTTKFYVASLYADFVQYGVWIDGNGVTGQIANATTQHNDQTRPNTSLAQSEGLLIAANNVGLQIGNWRSQLAALSGIDVQQYGNRLDLGSVRIENWNGAGTGAPAINVADSGTNPTNTLNISGQPYTLGGSGAPVISGGNGASARTVLMNMPAAAANEPRFYSAAIGNPISGSAIGPDANIDFYLGAKGPSGSVRLRAQNSTVLRVDSPGPGDTDLLLRSGTGSASFITESNESNADVYLTSKGRGSIYLQSGGLTGLRATAQAAADTDALVTANPGSVTLSPENANTLADLLLAGQGTTGGVRLQANGATTLRTDNPGAGNSDLLVRSGTGLVSLILESGAAKADINVTPKGGGRLLQIGTQPANGGTAQTGTYLLIGATTGTAAARLTTDGNAPGSGNCLNPPNNIALDLFIEIVGLDATTGTSATRYRALDGLMLHGTTAAATQVVNGATNASPNGSIGAGSAAAFTIGADTTNGCLALSVTAPNADTWHWAARVRTTEVQ